MQQAGQGVGQGGQRRQGRAGRAGQGRAGQGRPKTAGFVQVPPQQGPVLIPRRTCAGTGYDVSATVPIAVGRRASVLDRSAPSRSRGLGV